MRASWSSDVSRSIDDAFVEGELRVDDVVRLKITRAEAKALREWMRQGKRSRRTRKTPSAQLDHDITEVLSKKIRH